MEAADRVAEEPKEAGIDAWSSVKALLAWAGVKELASCGCVSKQFNEKAESVAAARCKYYGWPCFYMSTYLWTLRMELRKKSFKIHCRSQNPEVPNNDNLVEIEVVNLTNRSGRPAKIEFSFHIRDDKPLAVADELVDQCGSSVDRLDIGTAFAYIARRRNMQIQRRQTSLPPSSAQICHEDPTVWATMPDGPQHEYRSFAVDIGNNPLPLNQQINQEGSPATAAQAVHDPSLSVAAEEKTSAPLEQQSSTSPEGQKPQAGGDAKLGEDFAKKMRKEKAYDFQSAKLQMAMASEQEQHKKEIERLNQVFQRQSQSAFQRQDELVEKQKSRMDDLQEQFEQERIEMRMKREQKKLTREQRQKVAEEQKIVEGRESGVAASNAASIAASNAASNPEEVAAMFDPFKQPQQKIAEDKKIVVEGRESTAVASNAASDVAAMFDPFKQPQ